MSIDFQPAIFDFLSQRRSVDLPGLGRLQWEEVRARRNEQEQTWIPSAIRLRYLDSTQSNEAFLDHLSGSLGMPFSDIKMLWHKWLKEFESQLNDSGRYMIDHVGTFNKAAGGNIIFIPDASFQNGNFYTPDIRSEPVVRPPETRQEPIEEEEAAINWLKAFSTAILILLLVSCIVLLSTSVISQLTGSSESKRIESAEISNSGRVIGKTAPEAASEIPLPSDSTGVEYVEEKLENDGAVDQLETISGKSCIIIVGSFKNMDYARTVETAVMDMGYKLYTEPYNGYHRVGIEFDCLTQDLYRTLFQMKGRFGDDAWILKYEK